jgi:hypothetical protein
MHHHHVVGVSILMSVCVLGVCSCSNGSILRLYVRLFDMRTLNELTDYN